MSPLATFSRQTSAHRSKTWCRYTFASSGDTTAPCGVPTFVSDHLLNDLVFQRGDAQWTLPPIGLRYVHSSRRLCPVRSTVHPAMWILEPIFQAVFILATLIGSG